MNRSCIEKKLIRTSLYGTLFFALLGIALGVITSSQMIVFDGLYSMIGVGLSTLSVLTIKFQEKKDWKTYPFGKQMADPLVILLKYFVIMILVTTSAAFAIISILNGGKETEFGVATLYSMFSATSCFLVYRYLLSYKDKINSALVKAESNQWFMDALISTMVGIGFILAMILKKTGLATELVPYIDPVMVLLASIYFIKFPILGIKENIKEVLEVKPQGKTVDLIEKIILDIEKKHSIKETFMRISKVGKVIWIEIDYIVDENSDIRTINDGDTVRQELEELFSELEYDKWLTVSFTENRKWAL